MTWQFDVPPAKPRDPHVVMFVFGVGPLRGSGRAVQTIARAQDPAWFDAWRSGSLRAIATQDLGGDLAALDAADHVHVVACEPKGVADLAYLQGAWDSVRELVDRGGTIVLDAIAMAYMRGASVVSAGAPLDVGREVRLVFETDATHSRRAHALHTRGMRKFGAPDLIALCTDDDVALVGTAVRELAERVARGTDLATPRHAVEIAPGVQWVVVEDEHRIGQLLQLNNEARVLVDAAGHDLLGVGRSPDAS